jgi:hypothetical protein
MPLETETALVKQYCQVCHNDKLKSGGMTLTSLDLAHVDHNAELAEKVIRKLRAGMMPPAGARRPEAADLTKFAASLEAAVDQAAANHLNPGKRPFQRLTRTEYAQAIHELLQVDLDVTQYLPPDAVSGAFDDIADVQSFSATLMDGYMRAAAMISREALGVPKPEPAIVTYSTSRTTTQTRYVDGAPFGTRGGIVVEHTFPADGEYTFNLLLWSSEQGEGRPDAPPFGPFDGRGQIDVAIDGERVALVDIDTRKSGYQTGPVAVKAGPHKVSAAFLETTTGLSDDVMLPIENTLAYPPVSRNAQVQRITFEFHLRDLTISGPNKVTGLSETPARRKIFTCRPTAPAEEGPCAKKIISDFVREAYRRPPTTEDLEGPMTFYDKGRKEGNFEDGIRRALQAILVDPNFLFRLEHSPRNGRPGQTYRVSDLELASRLAYFLWSAQPDDELIALASKGRLSDPEVLDKEVRRMLADPRAESLATRFGSQWLRLQDLDRIVPDFMLYPDFDSTLAQAMRRETELLFYSIVREDRNVLDLLNADYTFVNERLAKHYGIPNVVGSGFKRVMWNDDNRRGILGQGGILMMTSIANRTSPVQRGKWVLEVLLGTPPPPPPPNVPQFTETKAVAGGKVLSVRERMETHRANAACASCHKMIDPIGLALENFDVTGVWRFKDGGAVIDPSTTLYDGSKLNGPTDLRKALLNYSDAVIRNFTSNLLMYGLGRRVEYYDMPLVRNIVREAARTNYRFSSFVTGIVKSPAFQMNTFPDTVENH